MLTVAENDKLQSKLHRGLFKKWGGGGLETRNGEGGRQWKRDQWTGWMGDEGRTTRRGGSREFLLLL